MHIAKDIEQTSLYIKSFFVIINCESCQGVALLLGVVPKAERVVAGLNVHAKWTRAVKQQ